MSDANKPELIVRNLGRLSYMPVWEAMKQFTQGRSENTIDEIWLLEHDPVFTQGQAGKAEHVLFPGDIPVVQVDRGGQVTYHGPGQLVAYMMLDVKRLRIGARELVSRVEQTLVNTLAHYNVASQPRADAPGVYVGDEKIASLGLRISHGRSYHGLALNVVNDLEPFRRINPCGYQNMVMTRLNDLASGVRLAQVQDQLLSEFIALMGYNVADTYGHLPSG
ncbi:lipoate-protein ligase B [Oleiphilus messinensis]|uniref:Octanoyltransferase n=1 Tax=Oleiphilus messinensis TaxID=141451 RepID=A0A1Y0IED1_9GAMM|nr:lipoyl(octanoyl) transferase LipB [Oleiphilus messinensis]ARU58146.1 lipoate-protein ligase B [Oleiphilus messinensis]